MVEGRRNVILAAEGVVENDCGGWRSSRQRRINARLFCSRRHTGFDEVIDEMEGATSSEDFKF